MNADPRFLRTRVRRTMARMAAHGLDAAGFAALAARMARAAEAIDAAATALLAAVAVDAHGIATLDAGAFRRAPSDVRLRALARLVLAIGGADYPPRHERLAAIDAAIAAHDDAPRFKRTLGGVVIDARRGAVLLYRETGREGLATLRLTPGLTATWDGRFAVEVAADAPRGLTLSGLGGDGGLAVPRPPGIPAAALAAVPAVRRRGRVVAVPTLAMGEAAVLAAVLVRARIAMRLAEPPLFPDFAEP
jgi:tRNA(Ile)-lysidine synthase